MEKYKKNKKTAFLAEEYERLSKEESGILEIPNNLTAKDKTNNDKTAIIIFCFIVDNVKRIDEKILYK